MFSFTSPLLYSQIIFLLYLRLASQIIYFSFWIHFYFSYRLQVPFSFKLPPYVNFSFLNYYFFSDGYNLFGSVVYFPVSSILIPLLPLTFLTYYFFGFFVEHWENIRVTKQAGTTHKQGILLKVNSRRTL